MSRYKKTTMLLMIMVLISVADACILDLTPEGLVPNSWFGWCVSANPRIMVVGAPYESIDGDTQAGAVYIYEKDDDGLWQYVYRLESPSGDAYNYFGKFIDIDQNSDSIVISEPGNGEGIVYLYSKDVLSGWDNLTPVIFTAPNPDENFAEVAKINGDTVAVGAPRGIVNGNIEGVVYIYNKVNGTWITNQDQRLIHVDSGSLNQTDYKPNFGSSISFNDELLVIGSCQHSTDSPSCFLFGSACVYRKETSSWGSGSVLKAPISIENERFGYSVDVSNNGTVAVGTFAPSFALYSGKVYIFTYEDNQWSLDTTISSPALEIYPTESEPSKRFGWDMVFSGNDLYVGDSWSSVSDFSGTIYRYNYDGMVWNNVDTFTSSDNTFAADCSRMAVSEGYLFAGNCFAENGAGTMSMILVSPDYMADFDDDCDFDVDDIVELASGWLSDDLWLDIIPIGGDGIVNQQEFTELAKQYLR